MNRSSSFCLLLLLGGISCYGQTIGSVNPVATPLPADTPFLKVSFRAEDSALPASAKGAL
jgi:hypothetical protein